MNSSSTLSALAGALGFLSRLPVGRDAADWASFRTRPVGFPLAGYVIGALLAPAVLVPLPTATVAIAFVAWVYAVTGINHVDGLADLGDAMVVHGDADRRRAVMTDTDVGVGGVLTVTISVVGLVLAAFGIARLPLGAGVAVVIAAEVSAKLGMAAVVCFGTAAYDGLGAELTERATPRSFVLPAMVSVPAGLVTWPHVAAAIALASGATVAIAVQAWARLRLGGVSGDVMGAANEVGRLVALHAGVIAWTRF